MSRSSSEFRSAFNEVEDQSLLVEPSTEHAGMLTERFRDVVYRMTEVLGFYEKVLPNALGDKAYPALRLAGNEYRTSIKPARESWALICNELKHNSNVIVPVTISYIPNGPRVLGFGLCAYFGDTLAPNRKSYPNGKARCYAAALHQLVADVLKCENVAARFANAASDDDGFPAFPELVGRTLPLGSSINNILKFTPIGMGEKNFQDVLALHGDNVVINRKNVPLPSTQGKARMNFVADGYERSFKTFV